MEDLSSVTFAVMPILAILGPILLLAFYIYRRMRLGELEIKQRIAMIERGLVPAPELDPVGFERFVGAPARAPQGARSERFRTVGVLLVGLGVAIGFVIGFSAGELEVATGIGGAFVALGVACIAIAHLSARQPYVSVPPPLPSSDLMSPRVDGAGDVPRPVTRDPMPPSSE